VSFEDEIHPALYVGLADVPVLLHVPAGVDITI